MLARRLLAPLVLFGALALYAGTLAPSVAALFDDSLEFQLVGYRLAIAHPTGYPLYTLLLKASSYLPVGDVAYRANLLSALCAALAVALVCQLALRLTGSALAGAVAAGALAISPVFWSQAVVAEVYALNAVFVAALLLAALPEREGAPFPAHPLRTAFLLGLGLTHHRTIALLGAALVVAWLVGAMRTRARRLPMRALLRECFAPAASLLAPLLLYLYLPLRGHVGSLDGTYRNTLDGFLRWVTAADYAAFLRDNPFETHYDGAFWGNLAQAQFGWLGIVLSALGVLLWARSALRRETTRTTLLAALAVYGVFVVTYRVPDVQVFAIPVFMLMALALAEGFAAVAEWGARAFRPGAVVRALLAALVAASLLPVYQSARAQNDLSGNVAVRDFGRDVVAQEYPPDSAVVGILGEMTLIRYFQATEGAQPTLATLPADRDADRLAAIERELAAGRAVFTTRPLAGLAERYALGAAGPLVRVWATPPSDVLPADAQRVGGIRYWASGAHAISPRTARALVTWVPDAPVSADLKVSARLMDGERVVAQKDSVPVHNAYPTRLWREGARVDDAYDVALPPDAPGGTYRLLLILYRADSGAEVGRIAAGEVVMR